MPNDLAQKRALHAHQCVQKKAQDASYLEDAQSLPVLILTNGLAQTLAFMASKNETKPVAQDLAEGVLKGLGMPGGAKELQDHLMKQESHWIRRATEEALAWCEWHKRFAAALKKEGQAGGGSRG